MSANPSPRSRHVFFDPPLNPVAAHHLRNWIPRLATLGVSSEILPTGARLFDFSAAGLNGGVLLAELSTAGFAQASFVSGVSDNSPVTYVQVVCDQPCSGLILGQLAGRVVQTEDYFGFCSGSIRACFDSDPYRKHFNHGREAAAEVKVGVLEGPRPTESALAYLTQKSGAAAESELCLAYAPSDSLASIVQVLARAAETGLKTLHETGYDVRKVVSAVGRAPLCPMAKDAANAFVVANSSIIYGGSVDLFVDDDLDALQVVGPKLPASASDAYGTGIADIYRSAGGDFSKMPPSIFRVGVVTLHSVRSGGRCSYGKLDQTSLNRDWSSSV